MSGIVFLATRNLVAQRAFYVDRLGCRVWLDQADCTVFKHGNLLLGFCARERADVGGIITFFFPAAADVDACFGRLRDRATAPPENVAKYGIYRFFAHDPEERVLEFQAFDQRIATFLDGGEILYGRRSVREFDPAAPPDCVLRRVFELCRFAPTSRNSQSYYFKTIADRATLSWLAAVRGTSSAPIAAAPVAVAIGSDPCLTRRLEQDACIGAYHFMLSAWYHGLGTCWIGGMDRPEVKLRLGIPDDHYLATVTPVGFPQLPHIAAPERRDAEWFLRA